MFDNFQLKTLGSVCKGLITPYHRNVSDVDQFQSTKVPRNPTLPYIPILHQKTLLHPNVFFVVVFNSTFTPSPEKTRIDVESNPGPSKT